MTSNHGNEQTVSKMQVVVGALPISRDMKRYFWKKYLFLREHNGPRYAAEVFTLLRQSLMSYIDDVRRISKREEYLNACPVRKNGWLRKLFDYADCDPQSVLQFLKLYTCETEPAVDVEEASDKQHDVLIKAQPAPLPTNILCWVTLCLYPTSIWRKVEDYHKRGWLDSSNSRYISYKGVKYFFPGRDRIADPYWGSVYRLLTSVIYPKIGSEGWVFVRTYFAKWQRILSTPVFTEQSYKKCILNALPTPRSYRETEYGEKVSMEEACISYEQDVCGFATWLNAGNHVDFIADLLPESILEEMSYVNDADEEIGLVSGEIHHIPKKGTYKRRSIAAPNRFLQAGLAPCRKVLRTITRRIPNNCQFDQGKLDSVIYNHIVNDYAGSVDLSQATDWLPLEWFEFFSASFGWFGHYEPKLDVEDLESEIQVYSGKQGFIARQSYELFIEMTRSASWENGYHFDKWLRGQPLGTWPSFEVLTITHTLFVESCALLSRRWDSPYAILGDDVVIFDEHTRDLYVTGMERVGSPLSLHKSYDGRLAEFAGKYFIPYQKVAYSPGHHILHWNNLFDYQRTAKVKIPYDQLPKVIRKRFEREVKANSRDLSVRAQDVYRGIQAFIGAASVDQLNKLSVEYYANLMVAYLETPEERQLRKRLEAIQNRNQPRDHGFAMIVNHVGSLGTEVPLIPKRMPRWFKDKVRPVETNALIRASFTMSRDK